MSEANLRRVQFDLSPVHMDRLTQLKETTESATYAEVVKSAMRYYQFLVDTQNKGEKVFVQDAEGNLREVQFL